MFRLLSGKSQVAHKSHPSLSPQALYDSRLNVLALYGILNLSFRVLSTLHFGTALPHPGWSHEGAVAPSPRASSSSCDEILYASLQQTTPRASDPFPRVSALLFPSCHSTFSAPWLLDAHLLLHLPCPSQQTLDIPSIVAHTPSRPLPLCFQVAWLSLVLLRPSFAFSSSSFCPCDLYQPAYGSLHHHPCPQENTAVTALRNLHSFSWCFCQTFPPAPPQIFPPCHPWKYQT
mmetsp:Transcript_10360/g.19337  ORF Transcript_10360/g.19337 Transcript_10360/m.19337 type:complete len:232 (-) Transcript_10360:266-961(-)